MRKHLRDLYQTGIRAAGAMFAAANECIPLYEDGDELPCLVNGTAVVGKRFVQINAARSGTLQTTYSPPPYVPDTGLDTGSTGDRIQVSVPSDAGAAGAGAKCLGVAAWDAAVGAEVSVLRGKVLPVYASAAITHGQEVEVAADGSVIPLAAGVAVGMAVDDALINTDAQILVYMN